MDMLLTIWPCIILQGNLEQIEVYMAGFFVVIVILNATGGNHNKKADRLISFHEVKGK